MFLIKMLFRVCLKFDRKFYYIFLKLTLLNFSALFACLCEERSNLASYF